MSGIVGDNTARASGVVASAGGGAVLQVKSVQLTSATSRGGTSPAAISDFDIAFTPTAANSVLCLHLCMQVSSASGEPVGGYFYDSTGAAKIQPYGDTAGSRYLLSYFNSVQYQHLQSPLIFTAWFTPGDTTTRTIQVFGACGVSPLYINQTKSTNDAAEMNYARAASTFTITEYDGSIVTIA